MQVAIDEWRPGFAKRASNFGEVCNLAVEWRCRSDFELWRLKDAVAVGTPDLTDGERSLLAAYCTYLSPKKLARNDAFVFPSSRILALQLGCSESTVRDRRRALEAKGYIVRDYNHANRPAGDQAIDLSPLCARYDELLKIEKAAHDANRAIRDQWQAPVVNARDSGAQAPGTRRLKQFQLNREESLEQGTVEPLDERSTRSWAPKTPATTADGRQHSASSTNRPARGKPYANGSPERARAQDRAPSDPSAIADMLRSELAMAVRVAPALSGVLGPDVLANPATANLAALVELERIAADLLPEQHRNNELTVRWGWSRHGVRTAAMLAIAIGDPKVENPCRYFGRLACSEPGSSLDLRLNLARILKERGLASTAEPPAAAPPRRGALPPGAEDPVWLSIAAELRRRLSDDTFDAWFSQVGFHGICDDVLSLSAPGTAADRIKQDLQKDVLAAAAAAGLKIRRVMISVAARIPGRL